MSDATWFPLPRGEHTQGEGEADAPGRQAGALRPDTVPLKYHRSRRHGFSMVYPEIWHVTALDNDGAFFESEDGASLSVEVTDLGTPVTAADLPALRAGFLRGLRGVPEAELLSVEGYDVGFLVGLEAHQRVGVGLRWVRVLYKDSLQVRLVAQAPTDAAFERWLSCFKPSMTGFRFDGGIAPSP